MHKKFVNQIENRIQSFLTYSKISCSFSVNKISSTNCKYATYIFLAVYFLVTCAAFLKQLKSFARLPTKLPIWITSKPEANEWGSWEWKRDTVKWKMENGKHEAQATRTLTTMTCSAHTHTDTPRVVKRARGQRGRARVCWQRKTLAQSKPIWRI